MLWELLALQVGFFVLLLFGLKKLFHGHLLNAIGRMDKLHQKNVQKEDELKKSEIRMQQEWREKQEKLAREVDERRKRPRKISGP